MADFDRPYRSYPDLDRVARRSDLARGSDDGYCDDFDRGGVRGEPRAYGFGGLDDRRAPPPPPPPPLQLALPPPPPPPSTAAAWCFGDPEMKRRRRVASYKAYAVEGRVKTTFRRGFRWIKEKCSEIIHGW